MYVVLNNLNFKFIIQKRVFTFLIFPCVGIFWRDRRSQVWIKTGNKVEQRVWEDAEKAVYPVWSSLSTPREVPAGRSYVTPNQQNHSRIMLPPTIGLSYDWLTYLCIMLSTSKTFHFLWKKEKLLKECLMNIYTEWMFINLHKTRHGLLFYNIITDHYADNRLVC